MNEVELKSASAVRTALLNQLNACGMHALPNAESAILAWFTDKGVTASAPNGYLVLVQADGSAVVPSSACETLRKELPHLFTADPARDTVSSLQDLERGSASEIARAKSGYISKHGLVAYQRLPKTKAEAELKAVPVSLDLTRSQYLALTFSEKARLAGAIGAEGIGQIMSRRN
jgi:hypothetical protein